MSRQKIKKVGVIGTGFMGSGIAQVSAMAGFDVKIFDSRPEAVNKAADTIRWSLEKLKSKGRFDGDPAAVASRLGPVDSLEAFADSDVVIEAIYENISAKHDLLDKLGKIVRPDTLIGSNTSSIPIAVLSEKVPAPERFIGVHFFGPVPLMKLIELVMGPATTEETLERAKDFSKLLGKTPIVVRKVSQGFLVNRIFNAATVEAMRCWFEGVGTPEDIDTGMKLGYGWGAGPFEILDNAGIDTIAAILTVKGGQPPSFIKEMLDKGWLGRKAGRGFYKYGPDGKKITE